VVVAPVGSEGVDGHEIGISDPDRHKVALVHPALKVRVPRTFSDAEQATTMGRRLKCKNYPGTELPKTLQFVPFERKYECGAKDLLVQLTTGARVRPRPDEFRCSALVPDAPGVNRGMMEAKRGGAFLFEGADGTRRYFAPVHSHGQTVGVLIGIRKKEDEYRRGLVPTGRRKQCSAIDTALVLRSEGALQPHRELAVSPDLDDQAAVAAKPPEEDVIDRRPGHDQTARRDDLHVVSAHQDGDGRE
jgi:hypothetical protein